MGRRAATKFVGIPTILLFSFSMQVLDFSILLFWATPVCLNYSCNQHRENTVSVEDLDISAPTVYVSAVFEGFSVIFLFLSYLKKMLQLVFYRAKMLLLFFFRPSLICFNRPLSFLMA